MASSSITFRVKRNKSTFFVTCYLADSILVVKRKLAKLVLKEPRDLRILVPKDPSNHTKLDHSIFTKTNQDQQSLVELEDKAILDQLGIPNDAVLFLSVWMGGGENSGSSAHSDGCLRSALYWEPVDIPEPAPLVEPSD